MKEEHSDCPFSSRKQEIKLPCERCPPCTRRKEDILTTRGGESGAEKSIQANFVKPTLIFLVTSWIGRIHFFPVWVSLTLTLVPHSQNFWHQIVWSFAHTKQFCETSCMSYNLTQFWHCLTGDSIRSHRLRAQPHKTAPHVSGQPQVLGPQVSYNFCLTCL